mmetsp:Transcript_24091/g.42554  ORF Transcript_24091/g.42554 Transcript_24091/m.42554 type:complete len:226 (+) Transcript_24091:861-1538(+)
MGLMCLLLRLELLLVLLLVGLLVSIVTSSTMAVTVMIGPSLVLLLILRLLIVLPLSPICILVAVPPSALILALWGSRVKIRDHGFDFLFCPFTLIWVTVKKHSSLYFTNNMWLNFDKAARVSLYLFHCYSAPSLHNTNKVVGNCGDRIRLSNRVAVSTTHATFETRVPPHPRRGRDSFLNICLCKLEIGFRGGHNSYSSHSRVREIGLRRNIDGNITRTLNSIHG